LFLKWVRLPLMRLAALEYLESVYMK
jgi:hypothetical protein